MDTEVLHRSELALPEHFALREGYACYQPVGKVSLEETIDLLCAALIYCRENKIPRLLCDITQLTGIGPLQTLDRYRLGEQCAYAAQSAVKAALVARPELIDPDRFGVTVARNRGLDGNVFTTEAEALQWLLGKPAA